MAERVRVTMSPEHTKAFASLPMENIGKYEKAFGEITFLIQSTPEEK